jgi:mannose-6-phosphate isomerase-like protein (cupin superfamily)
MSIAAGRIPAGAASWIHVHPAVTQVTYLVHGGLTVSMKEPDGEPYCQDLTAGQATVSQPGTLLQLKNTSEAPAEVLYIVSPPYVFEMQGESVTHDDAILVAKSWTELEAAQYTAPALEISRYEATARRAEAKRRLAALKGRGPKPLAQEVIRTLSRKLDYLAPDGSEIRLCVAGDNGGFAHCTLPAGAVSGPVRHRTVEELWYVLEGEGEVWRGREGGEQRTDAVKAGDSLRIPVGTSFQFRASGTHPLELLLATMGVWPGSQEAVPVDGRWPPTVRTGA